MNKWIYIVLVVCLYACDTGEFSEVSDGIKKKLVVFGDGNTPVANAKYVAISFSVSAMDEGQKMEATNEVFLSDFHPSIFGRPDFADDLKNLTSGDSVLYSLSYQMIKNQILDEFINNNVYLKDSSEVKLGVRCHFSMTEEEYLAYREAEVRKGVALEMTLINEYIERENLEGKLTRKGDLFYMKTKEMSTRKVTLNDDIAVAYTCSFLNGSIFNKVTEQRPQFMNVSAPDQVIKGIESVIKEMNEGEMCRIVIPSYLAFGEKGSSDGAVPPKTPILADVHLVEIMD